MSVLQHGMVGTSGAYTGDIGHSLRLRKLSSAYLGKTIGAGGANTKHVASFWHKKEQNGGSYRVLYEAYQDANNYIYIYTTSTETIGIYWVSGGSAILSKASTLFLRDFSSHFHVYFRQDTTLASAEDRFQLYVNGTRITSWAVNTNTTTQSVPTPFGGPHAHWIGADQASVYSGGYFSRFAVSWQPSTIPEVTAFGYFNTQINEWVSKTQGEVLTVVEAGGTNSFLLDFDNGTSLTTLGYDKSSRANHWTVYNVSLTAGIGYDWMLDVPGNSYNTINPNWNNNGYGLTQADGNLYVYSSAGSNLYVGARGYAIPRTGSWVFEGKVVSKDAAAGQWVQLGIINTANNWPGSNTQAGAWSTGYVYYNDGAKENNNVGAAYGASYTTGDVIGVVIDRDAGTLTYYKNGVSQGVAYSGISAEVDFTPLFECYRSNGTTNAWGYNAGQQGLAYPNAYGSARPLCQANFPEPSAALLDPTDHHVEVLVTKSSTTQNFTLPWDASTYDTFFEIKRRDAAGSWYQIDGLRGYNKYLVSNSTAAEVTDANVLSVSGTTCTLGSSVANGTYAISATKAGLSSARQTNTDGSITSTVSRNVDSGFSIVTYTGTGANATVGHGLGTLPKTVIVKRQSGATGDWCVWNQFVAATGSDKVLFLNTTHAATVAASNFNSSSPTTSVINLGTNPATNSTSQHIAYCYADSAIQKSFSYTGNGSADGPYVNLGFKCGRTLVKRTDSAESWIIEDSTRDTDNSNSELWLYANTSSAESTQAGFDLLSTGFKPRNTVSGGNISGGTYIGHAWAAVTGKYSAAR